jgi:hypothetical protein
MRTSCRTLLLLLFTLPALVQAQFTYTTNNGTVTITGYVGSGGAATIPDRINGLPVTSIEDYVFQYCSSLTNVTIGNNITNIGDNTFVYCTNLTNVEIGANVAYIGDNTFSHCTSLTSVTIPNSATIIPEWMFAGCTSLTSVTIPNTVTFIDDAAFAQCSSLTSVTIPDNVTYLGGDRFPGGAFAGCSSLTALYFKGNAPGVGPDPFAYDNNATVYYLPGTAGWDTWFGDRPTALWFLPNPLILTIGPSFGVKTNQFGFTISWATNLQVVVEACPNLVSPVWSPLATNTLSSGSFYFSDPQWTNYPYRFYRLRSP